MTKRKSTQDPAKRYVYYVAALAVTLRFALLLLVWNHPERCMSLDTESYTSIAVNVLAGHGYSSCLTPPYWPDICRTPVYPLFLSAIMAIWGQNWIAVAVMQIVLDVMSGVLIFHTGRALYGIKAGLWAGILFAVSLSSAMFNLKVLSETLCVFLMACSLFSLSGAPFFQVRPARISRIKRIDRNLFTALFWALAVLCKPVVLVTAPFFGWWLLKKKNNTLSFALVIAAGLLPVAIWTLRNGLASGHYVLSSVVAVNRLHYDAAGLVAGTGNQPVLEVRENLRRRAELEAGKADYCSENNAWIPVYRRLGDSIVAERPVQYSLLHLRGALNGLIPAFGVLLEYTGARSSGSNTLSVLQEQGVFAAIKHYFSGHYHLLWVVVPMAGLWFFFLVAAGMGWVKWLLGRQWTDALFWGGSAALLLLAPGMASEPRIVLPAIPFLAVCAGYAWTNKSHKPPATP